MDEINDLKKRVQKIEQTLYFGNGHPPILSEITKLNDNDKSFDEKIKKLENLNRWMITTLFANLIGLLSYLVKFFIK